MSELRCGVSQSVIIMMMTGGSVTVIINNDDDLAVVSDRRWLCHDDCRC